MKIGFVMQPWDEVSAPTGGASSVPIVTYQLARQLVQQHDVVICCRQGDGQAAAELDKYGILLRRVDNSAEMQLNRWLQQLDRHQLTSRLKPYFASAAYGYRYIRRVARQLAQERCDVIQIHNFAHFATVIRRSNPQAKIVLHMHCDWLAQLDIDLIERQLAVVDQIIACSHFVICNIQQRFPAIAHKCCTLHNGVDERFFEPCTQPIDDSEQRLIFVGRLSPEKGVHVLAQAWNCVAAQFPQAQLTIVGGSGKVAQEFVMRLSDDPATQALERFYGGGDYSAEIKAHLSPAAAARTTFVGALSHRELIQALHQSNILLFPSVWQEPFGMPVVEAMAAGLPVIATRRGGICETVRHGETGLLVAHDNAHELAQAICTLLANRQQRVAMGQAGQRCAEQHFRWSHIGEQLNGIYTSVFTTQDATSE